MAEVGDPRQRTVEAVYAALQHDREEWRRPYLGPSVLGRSCERHLWLTFRWVSEPQHSGRLLALFERGDFEEDIQAERLRAAGVDIVTRDPATGEQFECELVPHVRGHADGICQGLLEAPKSPHVIDFKTASKKSFDKLLKVGAREWKPEYVAQLHLYMAGLECDRAILWVVCKDDDRLHSERFHYDKQEVDRLVAKAERIVYAPRPLARISDDAGWFECRFCDHHDVCQGGIHQRLERNCRTCVSATPRDDGTWHCDYHDQRLDTDAQRAGCDAHVLIPDLLPSTWEVLSSSEQPREVRYRDPSGSIWVDTGRELTQEAAHATDG